MDYYDDGEYVDDYNVDDPADFYRYGYGGFGYDTSHVPQDEAHSALYNAAKDGDLAKVQALVQNAAAVADSNSKLQVVNHARRWTEVEYKMGGVVTKEYKWFDRTPLMIAIAQGHAAVVKYLLEQGADPTLAACPGEDYHLYAEQEAEKAYACAKEQNHALLDAEAKVLFINNMIQTAMKFWKANNTSSSSHHEAEIAYVCAKHKVHMLQRVAHFKTTSFICPSEIENLLPQQATSSSSSSSSSFAYYCQERARALLDAEAKAIYIKTMIQTAAKFWKTNNTNNATTTTTTTTSSSSARYDPQRTTSQLPKNMNGMIVELDALGECPKCSNNLNDNKDLLPLYLQNDYQQVLAGLHELKQLLDQAQEAAPPPQKKASLVSHQAPPKKASPVSACYSYNARPKPRRRLDQEHAQKQAAALPTKQQQQQQTSTVQHTDGHTQKTKKCFFFAKKGSCRNGDDCQFSHELSEYDKRKIVADRWDYYRGRYNEEVDFYRPDGDTEGKDIRWCLGNGFYEIEYGLWSGDWYYRHHPNLKKQQENEKKRLAEVETPLEERKFCPVPGCKAWFKSIDKLQDHISCSVGKAHVRYRREHVISTPSTAV